MKYKIIVFALWFETSLPVLTKLIRTMKTRLTLNSWSSCLSLLSARITGHTLPYTALHIVK